MSPAVFTPRPYQQKAIDFANRGNRCALWLDMGLGKTVIALTLARQWLYDFDCSRILIVAPKRVAIEQWPREFAKWAHTADLDYVVVAGSPQDRLRALATESSIAVIGRDNLPWLIEYMGPAFNFDGLIFDESSGLKNSQTKRFKALRRVLAKFTKVLELTGTPAPNSLEELWGQLYCLDQGKRLGRTLTAYREAYFVKRWDGFGYDLAKGADEIIHGKVAEICLSMSAEDYLDLEPMLVVDRPIAMPKDLAADYRRLEKEYLLAILDGEDEIEAVSAGVLFGKLLQLSGGAVYDENRRVHDFHSEKLDELEELVEACGEPMLVAYGFQHERDRILERFPQAVSIDEKGAIDRWNAGEIPMLVAHPASAGHGLNLQDGGRYVVWYSLTPSLELYQQFNARLQRSGQTKPVTVFRLLLQNSIDQDVADTILAGKDKNQRRLLEAAMSRHGIPLEKEAA